MRWDIESNIQGVETSIQSKHVRKHDTYVVSFWPVTFLNTAIDLQVSLEISREIRIQVGRDNSDYV